MTWKRPHFTWDVLARRACFVAVIYLVLFRDHPDPTLIIVLIGAAGLPSFVSLDKKREGE